LPAQHSENAEGKAGTSSARIEAILKRVLAREKARASAVEEPKASGSTSTGCGRGF
jgi:hypothetical protein